MNALGIFQKDRLAPEDHEIYTEQPHYFWLGEVGMTAMLADVFEVHDLPSAISWSEQGSLSCSSCR